MSEKILMSKELKDPNFLGSHDLVTGVNGDNPIYGEVTLTIRSIEHEEVNDMELIKTGKKNAEGKQTKLAYVMHFVESGYKPYIVKAATVIQSIERATGTKIVKSWAGKKITFYVEKNVYMPGTKKADNITTDALRVRPYPPVVVKTYKCADCERTDVPETMAVRTEKAFGVILCAKCGLKRSELKQQEETKTEESVEEIENVE
jgi:transcription elongation factor Elf1